MLATRWDRAFSHEDWWFEIKWDGVRSLLTVDGSSVSLRSRRGKRMDDMYPELLGVRTSRPMVVDGEIVALDESGAPSFSALQRRINVRGAKALQAVEHFPVTFVAFDVLYADEPVIDLPIEDRRNLLNEVSHPRLVVSPPTREHGDAVFAAVLEQGLEGIVAKRSGSRYRPGVRSDDWRKVVHRRSARFVVGGYLPGEGGRTSSFASLLLGLWDGGVLRFTGAAGSGFDDHALRAIRAALDEMTRPSSPFQSEDAIPRGAVWVEPSLVAVVEFREWTHDHHLRAPVFKGFVMEPVESVTWEAEGPAN